MRIDHVLDSIESEAAGPSYTVPSLCAALAGLGEDVTLHVREPAASLKDGFRLEAHRSAAGLRRLGVSGAMRRRLIGAAREADVVHSHGIWRMANVYAERAVRGTDCRLMVSPRGMLDDLSWNQRFLSKRLLWISGQRTSVTSAQCLHVTSVAEYGSVRRCGIRAPVAVVPNGIDIPEVAPPREQASGRRRLLYLARIHPQKGLDLLLSAWRRIQDRFQEWDLRVIGMDEEGYEAKMRRLARDLGTARVEFGGRIPNSAKTGEFQAADLYVLPTHSESWGVSVSEALAHGVPAMVTRAAPWEGLLTHRCGWWIDASALEDALGDALSCAPAELRAMGARGRTWMEREYAWPAVAETMAETYRWVCTGGRPPACVVEG